MANESLALSNHPDLADDEEEPTLGLGDQPFDGGDQIDPAPESTEVAQAPGPYTIDRTRLHEEIERLEREDEEFRNALATKAGRIAANKYQPRLTQLELEHRATVNTLRRERLDRMPQGEIWQRVNSDPEFRAMYTEVMDTTPEQLQTEMWAASQRSAVETIFSQGYDAGLTQAQAEEIAAMIASGHYDQDTEGNPIPGESALLIIQADVFRTAMQSRASAPASVPPPAPTPPAVSAAPTVNPALARGGPDTSPAGSRGNNGKYTLAQVNAMDDAEFNTHFPTDEAYQRAIDTGLITGVTPKPRGNN